MVQQQRVAVGLRLGDAAGAERAAGAADILDDDLLAETLLMASATSRVTVSVGPPAAKGTTTVMALVGKSWAWAPGPASSMESASAAQNRFIIANLPDYLLLCTDTTPPARKSSRMSALQQTHPLVGMEMPFADTG